MVVRPAPAHKEAFPARTAAPDFPREPATAKTCPKEPLCELAARIKGTETNSSGPTHRRVAFPVSSISAEGEPMPTTSRTPQASAFAETNCPILGAVNVTVQCAKRTGPSEDSPSEGRPDGVSTASIRAGKGAVAMPDRAFTSEM